MQNCEGMLLEAWGGDNMDFLLQGIFLYVNSANDVNVFLNSKWHWVQDFCSEVIHIRYHVFQWTKGVYLE
jgi:hypothetical protein